MESSEDLQVPVRQIVQVKLFELGSLVCKCGEPIEVVLLSMTSDSRAIVSPHCASCAAKTVAELHSEGFHSQRDSGESLFNSEYVPSPASA